MKIIKFERNVLKPHTLTKIKKRIWAFAINENIIKNHDKIQTDAGNKLEKRESRKVK